jgi:hypothetical protein
MVAEVVMADRILTRNSHEPGLVYDISSGPNFNGVLLEQGPLMQDGGPQTPPPRRACQKLHGENVPFLSQSKEKDLPAFPQPVQYYERATSIHQGALLSRGHGSSLGAGPERITKRIQSYSRESQSSFQFISEAQMAAFWEAILSVFRQILSQYGESHVDSAPAQNTNDLIESYPRGMRLFLILLSGALPYVVVSVPPDGGILSRVSR